MQGLTSEQRRQYERDGVVYPVDVFSAEDVREFRDRLDVVSKSCRDSRRKRVANLHLFLGWACRLVCKPPLLDAVEDLIGGEILVDGTLVISKPPHDSRYVTWHQDSVYSDWHKTPTVSAWVALTPSTSSNGCLRVIVGSHKQGQREHSQDCDSNNLLQRGERLEVDEARAVNVELLPGQISLHHCNVVHGSNPNASDVPRIGFVIRFVTNQFENRSRRLFRVRGSANCNHLDLADPPQIEDEGSAVAAWLASDQ